MFVKSRGVTIFVAFVIIMTIIVFPEISYAGVIKGLLTSTKILIPSLYPFMVCVLMIIKSDIKIKCKILNRLIYKFFGQSSEMFLVFVLSLIGGYPVGARMINELYKKSSINKTSANIMLTFCVNAGPAFIISAAGIIFNSKKLGAILLFAHIFSSIIIALFCSKRLKIKNIDNNSLKNNNKKFSEIFTESVADATSGIISICSFVVVFSVINAYIDYLFKGITFLENLSFLTEVTTAVQKSNNVYLISFLLSFACLSIWFQIIAMLNIIKVNIKQFVIGRITHGIISVLITYATINIFNVKITVFSNNVNNGYKVFYDDIALFISMIIMTIILLIFFISKNNSGKLINDML